MVDRCIRFDPFMAFTNHPWHPDRTVREWWIDWLNQAVDKPLWVPYCVNNNNFLCVMSSLLFLCSLIVVFHSKCDVFCLDWRDSSVIVPVAMRTVKPVCRTRTSTISVRSTRKHFTWPGCSSWVLGAWLVASMLMIDTVHTEPTIINRSTLDQHRHHVPLSSSNPFKSTTKQINQTIVQGNIDSGIGMHMCNGESNKRADTRIRHVLLNQVECSSNWLVVFGIMSFRPHSMSATKQSILFESACILETILAIPCWEKRVPFLEFRYWDWQWFHFRSQFVCCFNKKAKTKHICIVKKYTPNKTEKKEQKSTQELSFSVVFKQAALFCR